MEKGTVAVAMSGGVDSSLTASMLLEQGYKVFGITLRLWVDNTDADDVPLAVTDAKKMCDFLGIEHHVVDARDVFYDNVVDYFVQEYAAGRTPNPCVFCNKNIKFDLLLNRALELGATHMVTGHYAQVRYNEETGLYELHKGADPSKDQSYVLYTLNQHILSHLMFPLGSQKKTLTRAMANDRDLPVANKPDSEDICFLPNHNYQGFIEKQLSVPAKPGNIVHENGEVLGRHNGLFNYTIGQRKGLGVAYKHPLYVVRLDSEKNEVVVGPDESLFTNRMICKHYNFLSGTIPQELHAAGKIRYAANPAPCVARILDDETMEVIFETPQRAITPGQSVVFYEGTQVLGGGVIETVC
ncbi:MAG: tRNA 2-thiouridine(34) synthase MnmA [Veillonella sp.]|uniref:tRNA 2-thiouridine(34) synthase MnmA n=1 Tax=Veillonella sp. TaxID=1926307 RepID=UPI0025E7902E|nr:tRNA 2-thiouridine(34) synthase MnmA [Veillonella sp.]MBS4912822.1 tRNA 2-thiouridine(34) synthase MnmA [Veillonella sp.]